MPIREALTTLVAGGELSASRTEEVFEEMLTGLLDEAQIAAFLALIQRRGATVDELVGAARTMRRHAALVPGATALGGVVLDTCGTGGAPKTFNISTLAALAAAAATGEGRASAIRVRVAKHGNRSRSGRGSAEVLAALGVNIDAGPAAQARCLRECGVCFCFAIHHHPAARFAAGVRRSLAFATIFNLLGPLTNPAGATHQVLGVYEERFVSRVGEALRHLGSTRAMVVHGSDGMDEITTTGATTMALVSSEAVVMRTLEPEEAGIARAPAEALRVADLAEAVKAAHLVLSGAPDPKTDIVALNAGAALMVAGAATSWREGVEMARHALRSGAAARTLDQLARLSHEPTSA
jgi:anthranilate phosphoribosyltransferase